MPKKKASRKPSNDNAHVEVAPMTAAVLRTFGAPAGASPSLLALYKALHVPEAGLTPWETSLAEMQACTWQEAPARFKELRGLYKIALEIFGQFRRHDKSNGSNCLELVVGNNTRRMRRLLRETRVRTLQDAANLVDVVEETHKAWIASWERQETAL